MDYKYRQLAKRDFPLLIRLLKVFGKAFGETSNYQSAVPSRSYISSLLEKSHIVVLAALADLYTITLQSAINNRQSRRQFKKESISLAELSFLLWATQGIRQPIDYGHALRTVPSAGARHALETYLAILNAEDLDAGFYRYLPVSHSIMVERLDSLVGQKITGATFHQNWMADAAVVFIWAAIPYRMEWRYGLAAHRVILLDAGHVCQNLYLACEAIGAGTCAVAAYDQEQMDQLLGIDGDDEFVIYTAAVGRPQ
jgi:SagB-type dehydrogenase family enzyme